METFKFEKEANGKWYIVLPEWEGDHWELEMVMGADKMLDILAQGEFEVHVNLSTEPLDNAMRLTFDKNYEGGAWYNLKSDLFEFPVWLCHVTKLVFGKLPNTIWIAH